MVNLSSADYEGMWETQVQVTSIATTSLTRRLPPQLLKTSWPKQCSRVNKNTIWDGGSTASIKSFLSSQLLQNYRRFSHFSNWLSWTYNVFSKITNLWNTSTLSISQMGIVVRLTFVPPKRQHSRLRRSGCNINAALVSTNESLRAFGAQAVILQQP